MNRYNSLSLESHCLRSEGEDVQWLQNSLLH